MARRRDGERGAESLEFLGLLPLLMLVILVAWQGLTTLTQYAEAQSDAQLLARSAVICGAPVTSLHAIDPSAGPDATAGVTTAGNQVTVKVSLTPRSVFSQIDLRKVGFPIPSATIVMRHEPCA